jgi:seryl-tRNA synthetase
MSDEDLQAQIDELKSKNKRLSDDLKAARDSAKDADSLKARVSELTEQMSAKDAELKETRAEARDRRLELRKVETERDEIAGRVEALTTERDTLATRLETEPNEYKQKFEQVAADLSDTKHQVAYRKVADSFKVDTENLTKYNDFLKTATTLPRPTIPTRSGFPPSSRTSSRIVPGTSRPIPAPPRRTTLPPPGKAMATATRTARRLLLPSRPRNRPSPVPVPTVGRAWQPRK